MKIFSTTRVFSGKFLLAYNIPPQRFCPFCGILITWTIFLRWKEEVWRHDTYNQHCAMHTSDSVILLAPQSLAVRHSLCLFYHCPTSSLHYKNFVRVQCRKLPFDMPRRSSHDCVVALVSLSYGPYKMLLAIFSIVPRPWDRGLAGRGK